MATLRFNQQTWYGYDIFPVPLKLTPEIREAMEAGGDILVEVSDDLAAEISAGFKAFEALQERINKLTELR